MMAVYLLQELIIAFRTAMQFFLQVGDYYLCTKDPSHARDKVHQLAMFSPG